MLELTHVKLVIFDWDGTLMNSVGRIVSSMQRSAARVDLAVPSAAAVKDIIGLSLEPAIKRLFGELTSAQHEALLAAYRDEYVTLNTTPTPFFDGAIATLSALRERSFQIGVATGKMRRGLDRIWAETSSAHLFDISRCADEAESKPSPAMLRQILTELKLSPQQAVMVGDSIYDMQMAAAIDMPRIGVSHGVHSETQLKDYGTLHVLSHFDELLQLLPKAPPHA